MSSKKTKKLTAPRRVKQKRNKGKFLPTTEKPIHIEKLENFLWTISVYKIAIPKLVHKLLHLKRPKKKTRSNPIKTSTWKASSVGLFRVLVITFSVFFVFGVWFWKVILSDLPNPHDLKNKSFGTSTKIYDRNGVVLYSIYKDKNRTPIPFDEIPIQLRSATVASEDADFYTHNGFSIRGIIRSIYINIKNKKLTGGSTITQQLVKNTLLTPEKTITRKIKEIILAIEVERTYSKNEILEMYLNEVPYGGTAYGIQEASITFFGKDAKYLTLAESALLASLPQSPTRYSPFGNNPEVSIEKKNEVLKRMYENGFINKEQELEAQNQQITFSKNRTPIYAPHFVFYVRDLLEEKYGKEMVQEGGLNVITSLDYKIQTLAEQVVKDEVEKLKSLNVTNAAVVVLNPKTGEVLAMVGSKDYFDIEHDGQVNVALSPRQPGSSIKVINYAYALENGLTPATIIPDTPITFKVEGQDDYTPKNYDDEFRGNITLRSALAESRNIPAVKILNSYGIEKMIELGTKMGITTWTNPKNYGLSLTLGGGEVELIDLAQVYATLADYGKRPDINPILSVTNHVGKTMEEFGCKNSDKLIKVKSLESATESALTYLEQDLGCTNNSVLTPEVAYQITDILKDNIARSPSFGTNSLLNISGHPEVAVKTGTSNDLRDNLAVGYTRDYLVAVWIGNNDNSPMDRIASGVTGATPIFNKIMTALLSDKPSTNWPVPERLIQLPICVYTGTLACPGCPMRMEWFTEINKPEKACSSEWFAGLPAPTFVPQKTDSPVVNFYETQIKNKLNKIKQFAGPRKANN